MTVQEAIEKAEQILPGEPADDERLDPRWQAIIRIGDFVLSNPEEVWEFVRKWGRHADSDLRMAIATCLLEHLLESHFDTIFPRIETEVRGSQRFASTFLSCWKFGESCEPKNRTRFESLQKELGAS